MHHTQNPGDYLYLLHRQVGGLLVDRTVVDIGKVEMIRIDGPLVSVGPYHGGARRQVANSLTVACENDKSEAKGQRVVQQ